MSNIRPPAVAGLFYPDNAHSLQALLQGLLQTADKEGALPAPKALIAPHAGYVYSGPIAASAYAQLAPLRDRIRRVVLLGPSHRVAFGGLALSSADCFSTPLGDVPLDQRTPAQLAGLAQVQVSNEAHRLEHSLEVHLPFLQTVLRDFSLVPLVVGEARAEDVAEVLDALWGGDETLIVLSTDLSHYHDYATAQTIDQDTAQAVENFSYRELTPNQACGSRPLSGLLLAAQRRGMQIKNLDLRNSGDTAGAQDSVVGYGAWALYS
jgi:AmmeMemoRadiSam system protein B